MDPVTLAAAVAVLVGKSAAEALGAEVGTGIGKAFGQVRDVLRRRFSADPPAQNALATVERSPEDTQSMEQLRDVVHGYVARDEDLARQLEELVRQAQAANALPSDTYIQAHTIKAVFNAPVQVSGNFTIS